MPKNAQLLFAARAFVDSVVDRVTVAVEKGELQGLDTEVEAFIADFFDRVDDSEPVEKSLILKADDEQRMIWGWASVAVEKGRQVVDTQGDIIDMVDLQKAAHAFISDYREAASMHRKREIGTVVESIVFTKALQDALGVDFDREGWFVGVHVEDDATWAKVKSGELRAFSIGGSGIREEVKD